MGAGATTVEEFVATFKDEEVWQAVARARGGEGQISGVDPALMLCLCLQELGWRAMVERMIGMERGKLEECLVRLAYYDIVGIERVAQRLMRGTELDKCIPCQYIAAYCGELRVRGSVELRDAICPQWALSLLKVHHLDVAVSYAGYSRIEPAERKG